MTTKLQQALCVVFFIVVVAGAVRAQQPAENKESNAAPSIPSAQEGPPKKEAGASAAPKPAPASHNFWDRENDILFAGVGAARGLDYASTLNLRRRGDNEIFLTNSIVDNHPLFAGIEAAATAASIGVSYLFHRTGHHRLERWTSIVHIGIAVGGAARNYSLKTVHNN